MQRMLLIFIFTFNLPALFSQNADVKLRITPITNDIYVYTTYNIYENSKLPANGMYLVADEGVVLFDTPWDTTQFQPLLDSIQLKHNKPILFCIATHWHSDKTAGLEYYKKLGINTYTTALTDELAKLNGMKRAEFIMTKDTTFTVDKFRFETYYPGEGHTADNIVIWLDNEKILYAGCLIKGAKSKNLGYLGDANVKAYYQTLKNVAAKYPVRNIIVLTHSNWDNIKSLKHSIKLAKKLRRKH